MCDWMEQRSVQTVDSESGDRAFLFYNKNQDVIPCQNPGIYIQVNGLKILFGIKFLLIL